MLKIIRYIIIFIIIMVCLFLLKKSGFSFDGIMNSAKKDPVDIYKQIEDKDLVGVLNGTSSSTSTVKSYIKEVVPDKPKPKISIDGIIYYTNLERQKAGLKHLIKNKSLNNSALQKVDDMFNKQYFEHVSPNNESVADLVMAVDYKYQIVGENLALGIFDNDKDLVLAWMNSPLHKENILNPKYTDIGVAVGIGEYKDQKQWMAVQHFAKPMPMCTEIDSNIQDNIDKEKTILEQEERELQKMAGVIESDPSQDTVDKSYLNNYNTMVNNYNDRLNKLRETITAFNKTIVDYNSCVKN